MTSAHALKIHFFKEFSLLEESFTPFSSTLSASESSHFSSHSHEMMLSFCYTSDPPLLALHFPSQSPCTFPVFFRPSGRDMANSLKQQLQTAHAMRWGNCSPQLLQSSLSRAPGPAAAQGSCRSSPLGNYLPGAAAGGSREQQHPEQCQSVSNQ